MAIDFGDVTRRDALKRATALLGGMLAAPALAACTGPAGEAAVGDDVSSSGRPIGLQLYTVRDRMQQSVVGTLEQVAAVGYEEVEFAGYFERPPEEIREALDRLGLSAPAAHVPLEQMRSSLDATLAAARVVGHRYIVVPWLAEGERTREGYLALAADLNEFGRVARDQGMRTAYHNHEFEFEPLAGGTTGFDILLEETDPSLVDIELDLFWAVKGGQSPVELFARAPGRFPLWHVKDMDDLEGAQQMVAVGQGDIDFEQVFGRSDQAGLRHFFVEHDNPEDPLATIRTSYEHLRQLLS